MVSEDASHAFSGYQSCRLSAEMGECGGVGERCNVRRFFETFVFSEIYKSYLNAGREPPIFYYRDKDQKEIAVDEKNWCVPGVLYRKNDRKWNIVGKNP